MSYENCQRELNEALCKIERLRHNEAFHVERAAAQDAEIERFRAALREAQAFLAAQPDGPRNDVLAVVRAALEGK